MVRPRVARQKSFYSHEELHQVNPRNFYMLLDQAIGDWRALAQPLYAAFDAALGRPTDPVVYLKIFLIGYLEGIVWDTELAERISDSMTLRAFLEYGPGEKTPDHSTISLMRTQLAKVCDLHALLALVVERCETAGMITGRRSAVDATLIPANASMDSLRHRTTGKSLREHLRQVAVHNAVEGAIAAERAGKSRAEEPAVERAGAGGEASPGVGVEERANPGRAGQGAGEATPGDQAGGDDQEARGEAKTGTDSRRKNKKGKEEKKAKPKPLSLSNEEYASATDPDARIASKPGQLRDLYYRVTHVTEGSGKVILGVGVSHADQGEAEAAKPAVAEAAQNLKRNGREPGMLSGDSGYDAGHFQAYAEGQGFLPVMNPQQDSSGKPGGFRKEDFRYDEARDCYLGPEGCELRYRSRSEEGRRYQSNPAQCEACGSREQCLAEGANTRWLQRRAHEESREASAARLATPEGQAALNARKHIVEPPFGHLKTYGGMRVMNCRGMEKAEAKAVFGAVAYNLIRLVNYLGRGGRRVERAEAAVLRVAGSGRGPVAAFSRLKEGAQRPQKALWGSPKALWGQSAG